MTDTASAPAAHRPLTSTCRSRSCTRRSGSAASGAARVKAGLHYIAINLVAASLFLIGAALIYGVTGTLNMAHLAGLIPALPDADRPLLHAGGKGVERGDLVRVRVAEGDRIGKELGLDRCEPRRHAADDVVERQLLLVAAQP